MPESTFGTLVDATPIGTHTVGASAWRIRYRSADVVGTEHVVSGLVVAPRVRGDDRPVVTWCHGTTGLGDAACPSAQPDPARELTVYYSEQSTAQIDYGIPGLAGWIGAGFVVCATDYQGLGTAGVHQYPVNRSNARDAIAIVHAARQMDVGAGTGVAVVGWSQGGGAAAAAAELDDGDFGPLELVACVPISPGVADAAVDLPGADLASLSDPSEPPSPHLLMTVYGHAAAFGGLDLDDILTPRGRRLMDAVWNTQPVHHLGDTAARIFHLEGPLMHANPLEVPEWLEAITTGSAGRRRSRCPALVCVDEFGRGTVVPVAWQEAYATAVGRLGGSVELRRYPDADHFSVSTEAIDDIRAWVVTRLGT
ncbi:MAG: lipase family protein [Acidimicrobiales bacterium]|jgi:pimeloyl-ACP methyl ester carboxylesterase